MVPYLLPGICGAAPGGGLGGKPHPGSLGPGASPRQEGEALYWWDESMEAEVLLYQRDKRVVQVTYAGPKTLLPCQDAWQEALFPGEKI